MKWIPIIIISTPKILLITHLATKIPTIIKIQINFSTNILKTYLILVLHQISTSHPLFQDISRSCGSKISHGSDACGSTSVGSSARPMGREVAKKRVKRKARKLPWRWWTMSGLNSNNSRRKSLNDWTRFCKSCVC